MSQLVLSFPRAETAEVKRKLADADIQHIELESKNFGTEDAIAAILIAVPTSAITVMIERLAERIFPKRSDITIYLDGTKVSPAPEASAPGDESA